MLKIEQAEFEAAAGLPNQLLPPDLPEFAVAGRSNVGKSTLINRMVNRRKLARVSGTPGKTATINFYRVGDARLVDLPGYGYAKVSRSDLERWSALMDGYFVAARDLRLVLQLCDMRHPPTKDDLLMIDYLVEYEMPFAVVLTKMDKLSQRERAERLASLQTEIPYADQITILPVSAQTGEGIEEIRQIIEELACRENETALGVESDLETDTVPETIFAQPGQKDDVEEAIRRFRESVRSGELENKQQEKLPTRQRKRDETCL
mgnify:CR=1 FL=1